MQTKEQTSFDSRFVEMTQNKIRNVVLAYRDIFPEEYESVRIQVKQKSGLQANEFASVSGDHVMERALHEIPENLFSALIVKLDTREFEYFSSKKGSRWFAKTFNEFALPKAI